MAVPANVIKELTALQAQMAAAAPLQSASFATIKAIQLNLDNLINDTFIALGAATGALDIWVEPTYPGAVATSILGIVVNANDQNDLFDILTLLGRVNHNIDTL